MSFNSLFVEGFNLYLSFYFLKLNTFSTSEAFTSKLNAHQIQNSMDGKGHRVNNLFVERL